VAVTAEAAARNDFVTAYHGDAAKQFEFLSKLEQNQGVEAPKRQLQGRRSRVGLATGLKPMRSIVEYRYI
jgi:hypothetical protein